MTSQNYPLGRELEDAQRFGKPGGASDMPCTR
jgi:hypothetical protein